jgi:conjugative transfer region protein TrbK
VERPDIFRVAAIAALVGVFVAALVTTHQRPATPAVPLAPSIIAPDDPLSAELRRCSALGPQDASDPRCQAVWEDNRRRFFGGSGGAS